MKYIFFIITIGFILGGCSASDPDTGYYNRANKASQEAHDRLNRD